MATASPVPLCPACDQPLADDQQAGCPSCHASAAWLDLLRASDFVSRRVEQWRKEGRLNAVSFERVANALFKQKQALVGEMKSGLGVPAHSGLPAAECCWSCKASCPNQTASCPACGAPTKRPAVRSLRYSLYLLATIQHLEDSGRLSLPRAHDLKAETSERIAALKKRLNDDRPEIARLSTPERVVRPRVPRRPLLEILLDPRSIQWLLLSGGLLLVAGLVIYLWAIGIFANAKIVAVFLGMGTAALLGCGWAVIKFTRFQTAGRALTLLACLIMPLNLWFYHVNQLITLQGQLWAPALVCCLAYAASALVLRDELFVYVFVGGLAMTGLLILADENVSRFWEIAAPSSMLIVMGLAAIHTERAFPDREGPFTRGRFGLAFFWSGHALLGLGLLLLLAAQIAGGWLYEPIFKPLYQQWGFVQPVMVTEFGWKVLALLLVLAGTYGYLYSDLVVRRVGAYAYVAVFMLLWAEILVINLLDINLPLLKLVITALAMTALVANLLHTSVVREGAFSRLGPPLALFLSTIPVLLGLILHLRATNATLNQTWPYEPGWAYVGAMLLTALSCRMGAYLYRHTLPKISATYFFGSAAATLVGAAALLMVLGVHSWSIQATLLMPIPIAYLIASRLYRGHTPEQPLFWVAYTATIVMSLAVLTSTLGITRQVLDAGAHPHLVVGSFFALVAVFFGLATAWRRQGLDVYLATAAFCGAVWQWLLPWTIDHPEYYTLAFALVGFALLIVYRLTLLERFEQPALTMAIFQSANALLSLAFVAAALLSMGRLTNPSRLDRALVVLLTTLTVLSFASAWLVQHQDWRRWYVIMAIIEALLTFVTLHLLSELSFWQKVEIFSVVVGLALLLVGHVGWYREQDRHNDMVSLSLGLGSALAGLPLAIAVPIYRWNFNFTDVHWMAMALNEAGMLLLGLALLASGIFFRLKFTTLVGGGLMAVYLVSLVLFIRLPEQVKTAALWLAIGGGAIFLLGLLLSIYRDRLLALPDKIKHREGIFRVLTWR